MAGTRNTLLDLNNHLFEVMERLNDPELRGECLEEELKRAEAIKDVAAVIVDNANTVLKASKFADECYDAQSRLPRMLTGDE